MKAVLFLFSLLPLKPAKACIRAVMKVIPFTIFSSYKTTYINICISFKNLSLMEKEALAKKSFTESICSLYETLYCLSRSNKKISKNIIRIDNRYLMSDALKKKNGLLISGIHNRSVDILLQWINTQTPTVGVYKPLKPLIYIGLFNAPQDYLKIIIRKSPKETSAQSMNLTMEKMILSCPEDYSWEYKRFKRPPEGVDNPYKV